MKTSATREKIAFGMVLSVGITAFVAIGCKSSDTQEVAASGSAPMTTNGVVNPGTSTTVGYTGSGGTANTATRPTGTGGIVATTTMTGTSAATGGSTAPAKCEVTKPLCAGLSDCPLSICYKISKDQMPGTCSCLSDSALDQCCAQVKEAMGDCLDMTKYPECLKRSQCPPAVLQALANNTYTAVNKGVSTECQTCMCDNCGPELSYVSERGETATKMLQCAVGNGALRDCLVCNSASPCDVSLATNLMTGPCNQEVLDACPKCMCSGAFDVNCLSLAGCLVTETSKSLGCSAAHATAECMATKCPTCATFGACPSNLSQVKPGKYYDM